MGIIEYIKNGLPHVTFGEFIVFFTATSVILKLGEDLAGKKYFGNFLYQEIKRILSIPGMILRKLEEIKSEVTYNGGKYKLKDAVFDLTQKVDAATVQATRNGIILSQITTHLQLSDDIDDTMKFKLNEDGGFYWGNRALYSFFGFTETNIKDFNYENYIVESHLEITRFKWKRAFETKSEFFDLQPIRDINKKVWDCEVLGLPVWKEGKLDGFYGTIKIVK
jgi:hypothetical protein